VYAGKDIWTLESRTLDLGLSTWILRPTYAKSDETLCLLCLAAGEQKKSKAQKMFSKLVRSRNRTA